MGTGLRRPGVAATDLTDTPASHYPWMNRWAEAAHASVFDGVAWMSGKCNADRAYVLFGDRVATNELRQDMTCAKAFSYPLDFDRFVDFCSRLHINVVVEVE